MDYIESVERQLDLPSNDRQLVVRELRAHFDEVKDELIDSGVDASQAESEAARRLGEPKLLASRLRLTHTVMPWKTALLAALPLLVAYLLGAVPYSDRSSLFGPRLFALAAFAALMVGGCVREFVRDRRPMWAATWFAALILSLNWTYTIITTHSIAIRNRADWGATLPWTLIWSFVMLGFALWASRKSPRLRATALIAQLLHVGSLVALAPVLSGRATIDGSDPVAQFLIVTVILASATTYLVIAIGTFALHRYSNAYASALFLFAISALLPGAFVNAASPLLITYMVFAVLSVILFARARGWRLKLTGLCAAAAMPLVITVAVTVSDRLSAVIVGSTNMPIVINLATRAVPTILAVVFVPLFFERRQREPGMRVVGD